MKNKYKVVALAVALVAVAGVVTGVIYKLRMNAVDKALKELDKEDEAKESEEDSEFEDWNDEYQSVLSLT